MTADFRRNLYEWARADLAAEVASGFAALRRLRSVAALSFFEVYGRLGETGRRMLLDALLKRAHPEAAVLTAAEREFLLDAGRMLEAARSHVVLRLQEAQVALGAQAARLGPLLRERLPPVLGAIETPGAQAWTHALELGGPVLRSRFVLGAGVQQLSYDHVLVDSAGKELARGLSPLALWGLGETALDCLRPGEEDDAADAIATFAKKLVATLPQLLGRVLH